MSAAPSEPRLLGFRVTRAARGPSRCHRKADDRPPLQATTNWASGVKIRRRPDPAGYARKTPFEPSNRPIARALSRPPRGARGGGVGRADLSREEYYLCDVRRLRDASRRWAALRD